MKNHRFYQNFIYGVTRQALFDNNWLDIEPTYRRAGWKVEYDKPGYCESYKANFTFSTK